MFVWPRTLLSVGVFRRETGNRQAGLAQQY